MGYLLYWARDCARRAPVMSDAGEDGQAPSEHDGDEKQRVETCTYNKARGGGQKDLCGHARRVQIEAHLQVK